MSLYKNITYVKGVLGLRGKGVVYAKEDIKYLTKNRPLCKMVVFIVHQLYINSFTVHSVIGRLVPLFNGLVPIYVTE